MGGKFILELKEPVIIRQLRVINSHKGVAGGQPSATERFAVSLGMEEDFSDLTEVFTWTSSRSWSIMTLVSLARSRPDRAWTMFKGILRICLKCLS